MTLPSLTFGNNFGFNVDVNRCTPANRQKAQDLSQGYARLDVSWHDVEQTQGMYDFTAYDAFISDLNARGIRCIIIIAYGNPLYENDFNKITTSSGRAAYIAFALAVVTRYKQYNAIFELWNEANIGFWTGSEAQYRRLLTEAASAIKAAHPTALLAASAISNINFLEGQAWLERQFKKNVYENIDIITFHFYQEWLSKELPENIANRFNSLKIMVEAYKPGVEIIITEAGYSTPTVYQELQFQAIYYERLVLTSFVLGIKMLILYELVNSGTEPTDVEANFGLLDADGNDKLSYTDLSAMMAELSGYSFERELEAKNDHKNTKLLLFKKDDNYKIAAYYIEEDGTNQIEIGGQVYNLTYDPQYIDTTIEDVEDYEEMVLTLTAGTNSYIGLADANAYFDNRLNSENWGDATSENRAKALIMATKKIDKLSYIGEKTLSTQALKFPRLLGSSLTSITPQEILDACCEEALAIVSYDTNHIRNQELGIKSTKMGNESVTYKDTMGKSPAEILSSEAKHLLGRYTKKGYSIA